MTKRAEIVDLAATRPKPATGDEAPYRQLVAEYGANIMSGCAAALADTLPPDQQRRLVVILLSKEPAMPVIDGAAAAPFVASVVKLGPEAALATAFATVQSLPAAARHALIVDFVRRYCVAPA